MIPLLLAIIILASLRVLVYLLSMGAVDEAALFLVLGAAATAGSILAAALVAWCVRPPWKGRGQWKERS